MIDAQFNATLASAPQALNDPVTLCRPTQPSYPAALPSIEVATHELEETLVMCTNPYVVRRDTRAATTVKSERREAETATRRRLHGFGMSMAIVAMGIFAGAALGICVAPSAARADTHHVGTTAASPASNVTPTAGVVRAKAAVTSGKESRSAKGTIRSRAR